MYTCTVLSLQAILAFTWQSDLYTAIDTDAQHVHKIVQYFLNKLYQYLLGILFFIQISIQLYNMYTCTVYSLQTLLAFTWCSVFYTDIDTVPRFIEESACIL